jgi:hypothetical protein
MLVAVKNLVVVQNPVAVKNLVVVQNPVAVENLVVVKTVPGVLPGCGKALFLSTSGLRGSPFFKYFWVAGELLLKNFRVAAGQPCFKP